MLNLALGGSRRPSILCIGAHCDDIEIGCGGTVLAMQRAYPGCRLHWFVLTSDPTRRDEALRAVRKFVRPEARGEVYIGELPDGHLPAHFSDVKARFQDVKRAVRPDLVFSHHALDRHQDHALISEVTWQTFRDHLIWEYEIPKYDGDLSTPNLYLPLPAPIARRKVSAIMKAFSSQSVKSWFTAENLLAMMRIRGLECRSPSGFAEAFHARKIQFGGTDVRVVRTRRRARRGERS